MCYRHHYSFGIHLPIYVYMYVLRSAPGTWHRRSYTIQRLDQKCQPWRSQQLGRSRAEVLQGHHWAMENPPCGHVRSHSNLRILRMKGDFQPCLIAGRYVRWGFDLINADNATKMWKMMYCNHHDSRGEPNDEPYRLTHHKIIKRWFFHPKRMLYSWISHMIDHDWPWRYSFGMGQELREIWQKICTYLSLEGVKSFSSKSPSGSQT